MSAEWQPPEEDWQPPTDPEAYEQWLAKFPEGIVEFGLKEGLTHAQLEMMRRMREEYRADQFAAAAKSLAGLRERLLAVCPAETRWPTVFREGFQRAPVMPEPERSELIRVLDGWVTGVERAYGGELRPVLTWKYFDEGVELSFNRPNPCDATEVYYRVKGRARWELMLRYTHAGIKRLYTTPERLRENGWQDWPGRTLEFVAVGWFEEAAFGFPTEPVAVPVPPIKAAHQV